MALCPAALTPSLRVSATVTSARVTTYVRQSQRHRCDSTLLAWWISCRRSLGVLPVTCVCVCPSLLGRSHGRHVCVKMKGS